MRNRTRCFLVAMALLAPVAAPAAGPEVDSCTAEVSYVGESADEGWSILQFLIEVDDCDWSSGDFEFQVEVKDEGGGSTQSVTRREVWLFNATALGTVEHRIQLADDEAVESVEVDEESLDCVCRE